MLISIALVVALLGVVVLMGVFRPERRKQYNEFRRPVTTASGITIYGDAVAGGISGNGMDCGCGGDGGGGSC